MHQRSLLPPRRAERTVAAKDWATFKQLYDRHGPDGIVDLLLACVVNDHGVPKWLEEDVHALAERIDGAYDHHAT